jgi:hypothetical protein
VGKALVNVLMSANLREPGQKPDKNAQEADYAKTF